MSQPAPAKISCVLPDSIAAEIGFEPGDAIVAIDGQKPRDLIDYQYLCAGEFLEVEVRSRSGETHHIEIEKDWDEDLGLAFETALFDGLIQCNNGCPFCFIDQQPPGKRETLYLKDDDYRLSFLYGSYLTLTNLSEREWERIERLRLSPLYVSVHATEPEVRSRLLQNPRAGKILEQLQWFRERDLQVHAQVVVCPGINDGAHLERTLADLSQFREGEFPAVASVAVVPVGLTRFRPPESALVPVSPEAAREAIARVCNFQERWGEPCFVWLSDEWFLIAGEELPPASHYADYPQIGNGVGSIRQFLGAFERAARDLPERTSPPRRLTWVVGKAVEKAFQPIADRLNGVEGLQVEMVALPSGYWGIDMAVTGLLTGSDLLAGLAQRDLGDAIVLPDLMLKQGEARFLDDRTVAEVADTLRVQILVASGVEELVRAFMGDTLPS